MKRRYIRIHPLDLAEIILKDQDTYVLLIKKKVRSGSMVSVNGVEYIQDVNEPRKKKGIQ